MGLNKGYLQASRDTKSNEQYTPYYAVEPLMKYIPKHMKIWMPFDQEWSAFYQTFVRGGTALHVVIYPMGWIFSIMNRVTTILSFPIHRSQKRTRL